MKIITSLVAAFSIAAVFPAGNTFAAVDSNGPFVVAVVGLEKSEGEIRKVDSTTKKITIKHGELKNLDMPAMTMVFQVSDPAFLEQVKAGDKVKFRADKINGAFTVTEIEVVK